MNILKLFVLTCGFMVLPAVAQISASAVPAANSDASAIPPRLPPESFAALPSILGPILSPSGLKFVTRQQVGDKTQLIVSDLKSGTKLGVPMNPETELVWYRWAGENRILISIGRTMPWDDDEAFVTNLVLFDVASEKFEFIGKKGQGAEGDDVLHIDREGKWLLLQIQRTIYDWPSVFRVDLDTLDMKEVQRQRQNVWEWYSDDKGLVRMGSGYVGKKIQIIYRKTEGENFKTVLRARPEDEDALYEGIRLMSGSDDGYVLSNKNSDRYALYKFNYATRAFGEKVFEHPENDIDDYGTSEDGKTLIWASYTSDREHMHWFDAEKGAIQKIIDDALPGRDNWVVSRNRANDIMMVWTGASNDPGSYYFFQAAAGKMIRMARLNEVLKASQMPRASYTSYTARDGVKIPAYLTLPKGRAAKNLPLIILPHGGPYGVRDTLDYDAEVQFLANRGYAVLRPNFRGSGGYGKAFADKGYGQKGRAMQDDLDDGMDWLVKQGIADPKRVCLYGSSYGGYAALWGATRNPERYRCAISYVGVTDLRKQLKHQLHFFIDRKYQADWREKVQGAQSFDLETVSPLQQVARLTVPVLVGHGEKDQRVPYRNQGARYGEALKKAGKKHIFVNYKDEGHGFESTTNQTDWFKRLDAFLAENNPS